MGLMYWDGLLERERELAALEGLIEAADSPADSPWLEAMQDVLHRVEQIGTPGEEEE